MYRCSLHGLITSIYGFIKKKKGQLYEVSIYMYIEISELPADYSSTGILNDHSINHNKWSVREAGFGDRFNHIGI